MFVLEWWYPSYCFVGFNGKGNELKYMSWETTVSFSHLSMIRFLDAVHTYPDIFESATFSVRIRLPSTRIRRIRKFLNPLSRMKNNKQWIRKRVDGEILNSERKSRGFRNIRICVDGALEGFTPFTILVTLSVFCLIQLKVWKFFPEPDGKKPSPPEILV